MLLLASLFEEVEQSAGNSCSDGAFSLEIELSGGHVRINNRNEGGAVVKIALRNRREHERS
jgi:hypothetical protein